MTVSESAAKPGRDSDGGPFFWYFFSFSFGIFFFRGPLVSWSPGPLVCWSPGLLVSRSAGLLVACSPGLLPPRFFKPCELCAKQMID